MTESAAFQQALTYVLKLALLTLVLSVAIKYGGPYLHLPQTPTLALALLLTPTAIVTARLIGLQIVRKRATEDE